jgi:hypothetical protein
MEVMCHCAPTSVIASRRSCSLAAKQSPRNGRQLLIAVNHATGDCFVAANAPRNDREERMGFAWK